MKTDILHNLSWLKRFSSMSTWWVTVILHIFSLFHALYPNNLSRCLAISMENGTGSISGPSSPKGWWEILCRVTVSI